MAAGFRSMLMPWMGGVSAFVYVPPPPVDASFVIGGIRIYPAVQGSISIEPSVGASVKMNRIR